MQHKDDWISVSHLDAAWSEVLRLSPKTLPIRPSGMRGILLGCPIQKVIELVCKPKLPYRVFRGSCVDRGIMAWLSGKSLESAKMAVYGMLEHSNEFRFKDNESAEGCVEESWLLTQLAIDSGRLPRDVEAVQMPISFQAGIEKHHAVLGTLDILEKGPGGYTVWDLKVTTKPCKEDSVSKYKGQLMQYAVGAAEAGYEVNRVGLWQINPNSRTIHPSTEPCFRSDLERTKFTVATVADAYHKAALWVPIRGGEVCNQFSCDSYKFCPFGSGSESEFVRRARQIAV